MRNEEDHRWKARWPKIEMERGKEEAIINAEEEKLLKVITAMNFLHMNDATRAMLRDMYPEVYERLLMIEYRDAEQRLVKMLGAVLL